MKVHHLNCGSMCPLGGKLLLGDVHAMVCHCLLIETAVGLVLVDTGLGLADIADPRRRLGAAFLSFVRPALKSAETAALQIEKLGYRRTDVRHIIVTHLDPDHAGGLADFPQAEVHLLASELDGAATRAASSERTRYRPVQWAHQARFVRQYASGERWFGFECVRQPAGLPPEILLVPLIGHTRGHTAVAVATEQKWLFHVGDAYLSRDELDPDYRQPAGLWLHDRFSSFDLKLCRRNRARLAELARSHGSEVSMFSSHDPREL